MDQRPSYGLPEDPDARDPHRPSYGYGTPGSDGYGTSGNSADGYGASDNSSGGGGTDPQAAGGAPVCPRHPDRVSYVRCKRCGRPACGECQRSAAVGMLCVDCERELSKQQASSRPRNAMGGAVVRGKPYVTYTIMAICAVLFLGQMTAGSLIEQWTLFAPFRSQAMPWTFITSGFLHGGIMHLLLNMYALYMVGQYLEQTLGHGRYAGLFLTSVIAGHTLVLLVANPADVGSWMQGTVGASGGVFGLFGALFVVNRRMGAQTTQVLVLIGLNLLITFTVPNISWQGHLGGLVMGTAISAAMFALRPKATPGADRAALAKRAATTHGLVIAAGVVLCLVIVLVKWAMVPAGMLPSL